MTEHACTHSIDDEDSIDGDKLCPFCKTAMRWVQCWDCGGEGEFDDYEEDAINLAPGESFTACSTCNGKGIEEWCPNEECNSSETND